MMRPAFVAIAASRRPDIKRWGDRIDALCAQDRDLSVVFHHDDLVVIGKNVATRQIGTDGGIVLGSIYPIDSTRHEAISPLIELAIRRSRGAELTRSCWGSYVAFVRRGDANGIDALRSPFGDLPCLFAQRGEDVILASDTDLLFRWTATDRTPDWTALSRFLLAEDVTRECTCLHGVRELLGGTRLYVGGTATLVEELWSPWDHVTPDIALADLPAAADQLRKVVIDAVSAVARSHGLPLLRLSGGLDSSIMAAALAANDIEFVALNMVTEGASGDERGFARTVADHVTAGLIERTRTVAAIDVTRSEAQTQPRPGARCFSQASGRMSLDAAADTNATIVMDGGGGDQVFCALRSARIAADCIIDRANRGPFWGTTMALAQLAQTSAWRAAIVERRTKGTPDSFLFEIYEANRATIREMLLEGRMMSAGLLDRDALAMALDEQNPLGGLDCYRILRLIDAEAWSRSL